MARGRTIKAEVLRGPFDPGGQPDAATGADTPPLDSRSASAAGRSRPAPPGNVQPEIGFY